jgi:hypothetical protein
MRRRAKSLRHGGGSSKGLPAMTETDAAFFFGREAETAKVLDLLANTPDRIITLIEHVA